VGRTLVVDVALGIVVDEEDSVKRSVSQIQWATITYHWLQG
jgi:hypothetical protein